jgi:MFS family permease
VDGFLAAGGSGPLFFATAVLFGMGMGLCIPPLNALIYLHSEPHFREYNANMMILAMHSGSFVGPFGGSWLIASGGYPAYCV